MPQQIMRKLFGHGALSKLAFGIYPKGEGGRFGHSRKSPSVSQFQRRQTMQRNGDKRAPADKHSAWLLQNQLQSKQTDPFFFSPEPFHDLDYHLSLPLSLTVCLSLSLWLKLARSTSHESSSNVNRQSPFPAPLLPHCLPSPPSQLYRMHQSPSKLHPLWPVGDKFSHSTLKQPWLRFHGQRWWSQRRNCSLLQALIKSLYCPSSPSCELWIGIHSYRPKV